MTIKPRTPARTSLVNLASDLRLSCMRISRRIRFESTDLVAPHQYSVLVRLEDAPRTPRELAEIERVSAPSMSRTVAALAEQDLVARQPDPTDGRQVIVSLTAQGRTLLKDIRRRRDHWMVTRLERLSPQDVDVLRQASAILARVAAE